MLKTLWSIILVLGVVGGMILRNIHNPNLVSHVVVIDYEVPQNNSFMCSVGSGTGYGWRESLVEIVPIIHCAVFCRIFGSGF